MNEQTNETKTYFIPDVMLYKLQDHVDHLQKRARKLNLEPVAIIELGRTSHTIEGITFDILEIELTGRTPKLNGWEFVATIEHGESTDGNVINVIRAMPGYNVPVEFRTRDRACDHCRAIRYRKDTYIVRNETTNEWKQVGSTCLRDYVGHKDAKRVAAYLQVCIEFFEELLADDYSIAAALAEVFASRSQGGTGGMNIEPRYELPHFLRLTARAIHHYGWTSKAKARESYDFLYDLDFEFDSSNSEASYAHKNLTATATVVSSTLLDLANPRRREFVRPEMRNALPDEDILVANTIEWAKTLPVDEIADNDYLANLNAIALQNELTWKSFGIAASMINAYQRTIAEKQAREQRPTSKHFGEIKKRYSFDRLELVRVHSFEGYYGTTYIYTFEDEAGNVFVWFTANNWFNVGSIYTGKATIKDHDVYRDVNQTIITRAKFEEIEMPASVEEADLPF
jgi:hypothetical protein